MPQPLPPVDTPRLPHPVKLHRDREKNQRRPSNHNLSFLFGVSCKSAERAERLLGCSGCDFFHPTSPWWSPAATRRLHPSRR
ncbi:hypothetical protein RRG08_056828 [Elysia crispata]|uniref:Uncharacterized protein n=1 Tax=Elysia crispata TaxID=231223 RepID=A0AAE1DX82_9GAST|nr:hypothetical protein RRG08_056828 [Elysia crispata]